MLLKIGDFSRLSQTTVDTLRHYDTIGLLQPAHIDQFTNYRYYSLEQLSRIHRIIALKELGLSLEQIGIMLNKEPSREQMLGMLALQEAELEQQVRDRQARLARVKFRLRMLEMEDEMPELDVVIKKLEPMRVLQTRQICAGFPGIEAVGREMIAAMEQHGVQLDEKRHQVNIYYGEDYNMDDMDITYTYPIVDTWTQDVPLASLGTMTVTHTEPVEMAATYIQDGMPAPEILNEKLAMLQRWCVANGYQLSNQYRFYFYKGPLVSHRWEDWVVEIQHVIEQA